MLCLEKKKKKKYNVLSKTRSYILGQIPIRVQKEIESSQPVQMNLKILLLLLSL